jgi:hypothetical protein
LARIIVPILPLKFLLRTRIGRTPGPFPSSLHEKQGYFNGR